MKTKLLLAVFAILYQVPQSNSRINEQLELFNQPQKLETTNHKETAQTHDTYGEISIKMEGGLKKIVSFSNKSNEATKKTFNAKKQKLHELRRLRKTRSNETSVISNKDIVKPRKLTTDFDLKYTAKPGFNETKSNEKLEENHSKITSKEEIEDNNSSHENMFYSHPSSLSTEEAEFTKEINSSSGDQNRTTSYRNNRNQFRHLWGQDRSIHSYRSASMHKKPFWFSPYHFPRAKVTVAGLNIPWFRLRSTLSDKDNLQIEPIQLSKPDNTTQVLHNNTAKYSTTLAPVEIRVTNISNINEQNVSTVNKTILPLKMLITLPPRLPHWPNFYKNNMDHNTSEKTFKVYKSVRVATKPVSVETEETTVHSKIEATYTASVVGKTTQGHLNETDRQANSRWHENETTTENMSRISNPSGEDVELTTVDNDISTYIELQNVTLRVLTTTLKPMREPQWPPWPQWLNEPLQKNKNIYNGSYVLNEYTANVYTNNEKSLTSSSVKLNDDTVTTTKIEEYEPFFDIASTYSGLTANIAALLPETTGITVLATTEANNHNDIFKEKSYSRENSSTFLPNLRNIVRCTQGCPLTPEFNPVCGTDDITYTNPGRLLCLQFCGLDVKVKKYQPCSSKHKLSEYPNMINLFINTAVESLKYTVKANASAPEETVNASTSTPRATTTNHNTTTPSTAKSTAAVYYVKYDSFSMNDDDEDAAESKAVVETATEMASRTKQLTGTTVVTIPSMSVNRYIEKLKELIYLNTDYNKHYELLQSTTTNASASALPSAGHCSQHLGDTSDWYCYGSDPSQANDVTHSSKKIESNLAALNNMLWHSGRDVSTKTVHAVTYSSRDVPMKRYSVTRAIKDVSPKQFKMDFSLNSRKSSNKNLILKQDTPHVDALDSVDEPNNNGRRFVESPFVDLPYSSGEYISPDENTVDIFQDTQKDSDDPGDLDSKFWGYHSDKERLPMQTEKFKEKTHQE